MRERIDLTGLGVKSAMPHFRADPRQQDKRRLKKLLQVLAARRLEGLSLFRPLPSALPFLKCDKHWQLADGSNQSSKTIHAAYKMALILSGNDPMGKLPKTGGSALMVGLQGSHLAAPMWKKLAGEGAFDIIRDEQTGQWRTVRPNPDNPAELDRYDLAYKEKWRPAPPLLPPRLISSIAWEDRGTGVPALVKLATGWELMCRSSMAKRPQGIQLHVNWFDEELEYSDMWVAEIAARNLRFGGVNIWSATPETGGLALYQLRERADAGSPNAAAFTFLLEDNPYILPEERAAFFEMLPPELREVKYYGKYLIGGRMIYPMFKAMGEHGCEPFAIPADWARFVILDPGRQRLGTLFVAVDPAERHFWVYDGMALPAGASDAGPWADRVLARQGDTKFEAFIIDGQCGRQNHIGAGTNTAREYAKALKARGVEPNAPGPMHGFYPGTADVTAREEALIGLLRIRGGDHPFVGTPQLQVMRGVVPELEGEIQHAHYTAKNPTKRAKLPEDLLDCLEYAAGFGLYYAKPVPVRDRDGHQAPMTVEEALRKKQRRHRPQALSVAVGT